MNEGLKEGERLRVKKSFYIIKSMLNLVFNRVFCYNLDVSI
jgi:hypothetical protein